MGRLSSRFPRPVVTPLLPIPRDMISAAAEAGADCVKLQKSSLKDKFNSAALARPYTGVRKFIYPKITRRGRLC